MKPHMIKLSIIVIAASTILFMYGCKGRNTDSSTHPLAGTWTRNFNGSLVTIVLKTNGSYTVDMTGDLKAEVQGRYKIQNDQVIFMDESGKQASTSGEAVYSFTISNDKLELTPINEPDDNRKSVAAATWTKS